MNFRDWQQLSPEEAAHELHRRVGLLPPRQQRAAIVTLPSETMLAEAFARADRRQPLGAVPYFLKDLFDVAGQPTFGGSSFLPEVRPIPERDSEMVLAMQAAGAVLAGKTHLHEFAYGITGENPHYGDCEHPQFPGRTTGGSSSGSAAVVAAGIAPLAIGTDTGGSVRVPAAFCGLFGVRLQPRDRLIADAFPLSPTFDTVGWFTANASDLATVLSAIVAPERTVQAPRGCYLDFPELEPEVATACRTAAEKFAAPADASTRAQLLGAFAGNVDTYNQIVAADAWSVHRRWAERYRDRYDPAVWQRLQRGAIQTPVDRERALRELAQVQSVWRDYFASFDFLILPATPFGALTKADCTLANRIRLLRLTAPASLGGLPVLTVPVALDSGLTSGLQIIVRDRQSSVLPWALALSASLPR